MFRYRYLRKIFIFSAMVLISYVILTISVTTRQGINWVVREKRIPLYLKALEYVTRHFQTRHLALEITKESRSQRERVEALFKWTTSHIQATPPGLPAIDDHPWHIVVRGYGETDQMNDIFSVLCSYVGFHSFFDILDVPKRADKHQIAFVFYNGHWVAFDVCHKTYFVTEGDEWASVEELKTGKFKIVVESDAVRKPSFRGPKARRILSFSSGRSFTSLSEVQDDSILGQPLGDDYYVTLFQNMTIHSKRSKRNAQQMPHKRIWFVLTDWMMHAKTY